MMAKKKPEIITTTGFIEKLAGTLGVSKKEAKRIYDAFKNIVMEETKAGNTIKLTGFMKFEVKTVPKRHARDPRTGKKITVPKHKKVVAKISKWGKRIK